MTIRCDPFSVTFLISWEVTDRLETHIIVFCAVLDPLIVKNSSPALFPIEDYGAWKPGDNCTPPFKTQSWEFRPNNTGFTVSVRSGHVCGTDPKAQFQCGGGVGVKPREEQGGGGGKGTALFRIGHGSVVVDAFDYSETCCPCSAEIHKLKPFIPVFRRRRIYLLPRNSDGN